MLRSFPRVYLPGAAAMFVLVAGCSGNGAQPRDGNAPASAQERGIARAGRPAIPAMMARTGTLVPGSELMFGDPNPSDARVAKSNVYASEFNPSVTNRYALPDSTNVAPKCSIATNSVNGLGVDVAGTLWVPQGTVNLVTTYAKGTCRAAALTLNEPNGQPADIAFSAAGTVYVSDIFGPGNAPGLISVYAKGASAPSSTLTDPSIEEADGVAVDKAGDVFLSTYHASSGTSTVVEFKKGKMPGRTLALSGFSQGIGLEFDAAQNLIAVDYSAGLVESFAPPYAGAPFATFPTKGSSLFGKLDRANKNLYVSDSTNGAIDVYAYPTGTYEYSISNGLTQANFVEGVAVDPSAYD